MRNREYTVTIPIKGTIELMVTAETQDEAADLALSLATRNDIEWDVDREEGIKVQPE